MNQLNYSFERCCHEQCYLFKQRESTNLIYSHNENFNGQTRQQTVPFKTQLKKDLSHGISCSFAKNIKQELSLQVNVRTKKF